MMSQTLSAPAAHSNSTPQAVPATGLLAKFRTRRAQRAAVRKLRQELASFDSPAAIDELLAMTERQESEDAEMIRSILIENRNRYRRQVGY